MVKGLLALGGASSAEALAGCDRRLDGHRCPPRTHERTSARSHERTALVALVTGARSRTQQGKWSGSWEGGQSPVVANLPW